MPTSPPRRRGDRYDATRVEQGRGFAAMFPFLMKGRNDSIAYYPVTIEVTYTVLEREELQRPA